MGVYRLNRPASQITTLEVIRSIDGPVFLTSCFTESHECGLAGRCNVREPLRRVHEGIQSLLENITIADMCEDEDSAAACHSENGVAGVKLGSLVSVLPSA
jgi:DNA-binding IscR family transcriptional regulator